MSEIYNFVKDFIFIQNKYKTRLLYTGRIQNCIF